MMASHAVLALIVMLTVGPLIAPFAADAQQAPKVPRVGVLFVGNPASTARNNEAFTQGLRELAWVEGQNIVIEYRFAEGQFNRLRDLAAELVRLKVAVLVVSSVPGALAAKNATQTIPIVFLGVGDPVESGLVASLARPGGNLTGLSLLNLGLSGKRIELLKECLPSISRVAVLTNPSNPMHALYWRETRMAAQTFGLQLQPIELRAPEDFDEAFRAATSGRVGALLAFDDGVTVAYRARLVALAAKYRLPTMYGFREFPDAGGLMSYGSNTPHQFRHAATYVDKILKGAKPADLPVEQPTKFEFVINLNTAKALGLTIPPSLLVRADQVIGQ
jgi:ABC-type uncharacterized transport system substrate-binding protein